MKTSAEQILSFYDKAMWLKFLFDIYSNTLYDMNEKINPILQANNFSEFQRIFKKGKFYE